MIYQLRLTLREVQPSVWRGLQIDSDMSMEELHYVIQTLMLWSTEDLYDFVVNDKTYGEPAEDETDVAEASVTGIGEVFTKVGDAGIYRYNEEDEWVMDIVLEAILPEDGSVSYPLCIGGARNSPPEGCGGPEGYVMLLEAIKDPKNPDREELLEWLGEDFDPEEFDKDDVNAEFNDPENWEEDEVFENDGEEEEDEAEGEGETKA